MAFHNSDRWKWLRYVVEINAFMIILLIFTYTWSLPTFLFVFSELAVVSLQLCTSQWYLNIIPLISRYIKLKQDYFLFIFSFLLIAILQTSNTDAKQFYLANGFIDTEVIKDYYKRIEPPDCFLLRKSMKEGYEILPSVTQISVITEGSTDIEN